MNFGDFNFVSLIMPIAIIGIIVTAILSKRMRKDHKVTRDNAIPMEAELFCFAQGLRSGRSGQSPSFRRSEIDYRIPNITQYEHLLVKRGNRYTSSNAHNLFPMFVITIGGETFLATGRKNSRLGIDDLGRRVNVLLRKHNTGYSIIMNDELSLLEEEEWANRSAVAGYHGGFGFPPNEDRKNGLSYRIMRQGNIDINEKLKQNTSLPTRIFIKIFQIVFPIAVIGGVLFLLYRTLIA